MVKVATEVVMEVRAQVEMVELEAGRIKWVFCNNASANLCCYCIV
jgi:hypothetical protein